MKKIIIIAMFVLSLALVFGQTNTPRTMYVHVVNPDLTTIPNGTGLTFTATSTGSANTLTNLSTGCGFQTTTVPAGVIQTHAKIQLGNFVNQWVMGDQITLTVTRTSDSAVGTIVVPIPDNGTTSIWWGRLPNGTTTYPGTPLALIAPVVDQFLTINSTINSIPSIQPVLANGVLIGNTPQVITNPVQGTIYRIDNALYTWAPIDYNVPAGFTTATVDFVGTLIPDVYTYTLNVAGPAGHGVTGPTGLMPFPAVFVAPDTDMENELVGLYTPTAAPAGFYWNPTTIDVTAGMFSAAKGVAMGSRSNGTKATYNYVTNIAFELLPIPTTTFTLNVTGPDGYAVSGPVAGVTDYVATDSDDMINELTGDYTIAAPPAGYTWAAQTITVSEVNFVANVATIEFVLNEIPPVVTPADPAGFPAGYPSTNYVNNAFVVTGVGVHNLYIPRMPTDTGAMAYYNGMWNLPDGTPDWTWLNVNLSAKAPVQVIVFGPTLPVELSSFSAILTAQNFVKLTWVTESETNMNGYNVFRNETADYSAATHIGYTASTNSSTQHVYSLTDNEVETNNTYYYWLECVDFNGTSTLYGPQFVTVVGNDTPNLPTVTTLNNAYPNPFKTSTTIAVDVKEGENATVTIYNILGQAVMTYRVPAGSHNLSWNGRDSKGNACGSGIYFYKLTSPTMNQTKKMVIVK